MQKSIVEEENKGLEKKNSIKKTRPQMCAKSPIIDPIPKREADYLKALNFVDNMTKRKRKIKKEDNKTDEVPNPSIKDFDPFAIFNNDLNLIENVNQED